MEGERCLLRREADRWAHGPICLFPPFFVPYIYDEPYEIRAEIEREKRERLQQELKNIAGVRS